MTDVTKMSDEKLIRDAVCWRAQELVDELASRLSAALEREREDVEAITKSLEIYHGWKNPDPVHRWHDASYVLHERLAAREKR